MTRFTSMNEPMRLFSPSRPPIISWRAWPTCVYNLVKEGFFVVFDLAKIFDAFLDPYMVDNILIIYSMIIFNQNIV